MDTEEIKALVEQNGFTTENTDGTLSDERLDELNKELLTVTLRFEPFDEDNALEIIKIVCDRLTNELQSF